MSRTISWSEISTAMVCQARWDLAYGGHLAGGRTFTPKTVGRKLSDGRAWGAAVAAWHSFDRDSTLLGLWQPALARMSAYTAMRASYAADIEQQATVGVFTPVGEQVEREAMLGAALDHYMTLASPLSNLTRVEEELDVPIPSRTGRFASNRYRFHGFIDGFTIPAEGGHMIVEFKFRDELTSVPLIRNSRQPRYYAWAYRQKTGENVIGAYVDERVAKAPKPARVVKGKKKGTFAPSHDKDQLCTPEAYVEVCNEFDVEPHSDVVDRLRARVWQHRVPIMFRPSELDEAGRELVSAAQTIRDLDSGARWPVRNTQPHLCRGCRYREACPSPTDELYLQTLFEFSQPKRLRGPHDTGRQPPASTNPFDLVGR